MATDPNPAADRGSYRMRPVIRACGAFVALGATLVAAALFYRAADRTHRHRQLGGALIDQVGPASHEVGRFVIDWRGGVLVIRTRDGRDLWSSLPGRAFVMAAEGESEVHESRGMFRFHDRPVRPCVRQAVTKIARSRADAEALVLEGGLQCRGGERTWIPWALTFSPAASDRLRFELVVGYMPNARLYLTYASAADEHVYGLGEQFSHFDLKGRRVPITVMEQGIGRGAQPLTLGADLTAGAGGSWHTSYAGIPHYLTSQNRSVSLENYERSIFDFRRDNSIQIQVWASEMRGQIYAGASPPELITAHTEVAGRMRPLPDWVHEGAIVGLQGGTNEVRRVLSLLDRYDVPVTAFWLQDWVGRRKTTFGHQLWWNWTLDQDHYPAWSELVTELDARGIRVLTYVNPFLADMSERRQEASEAGGDGIPWNGRNLYAEAESAGFLVRNAEGQPYRIQNTSFSAGLVDLSHAEARSWLKAVLHEEVLDRGASGFMADFGEALPWDAVLASGEPASRWHNRYPEAWAELVREVIEEREDSDELLFFTRAAYTRTPRHSTLMWLGDQMVTWDRHDGLRSALTGLLSGGLSGLSLNHSDIGGYTTIRHPVLDYRRSDELLKRWMEHAAFSSAFRSHEGNRPEMNVQPWSDESTLAHFAHCARLYRAWAPYRRQLVHEAARYGLPIARPLVLHYPDDQVVQELPADQYLLGTDLLVAPVLDPGADRRELYLPAGHWIHLWSGQEYGPAAGWVEVAAPLGKPPVFYRPGSPAAHGLIELVEPRTRTHRVESRFDGETVEQDSSSDVS